MMTFMWTDMCFYKNGMQAISTNSELTSLKELSKSQFTWAVTSNTRIDHLLHCSLNFCLVTCQSRDKNFLCQVQFF